MFQTEHIIGVKFTLGHKKNVTFFRYQISESVKIEPGSFKSEYAAFGGIE